MNLTKACFDKGRMWHILALIVLSVFPAVRLLAQMPEVSGLVRDGRNRPVANAAVSLLNARDSLVRAFAKTDAQGAFALKHPGAGMFLVSVAKIGFQTEYRPLRPDGGHLLFALQKDTVYRIEEVVVPRKRKIRADGDTVSYNLEAFRTGSESTLEQALARLPGFEIQENGKISVNGKSIQKILVEGDDIVNRQYRQLSQNLSPDIVRNVQVIDNYLDDPFFRTAARTDDIALNLQLKEDFKNTLTTTLDLEGGTVERYNASMNNLLLSRRTKLYALASANNTGGEISAKPMEYTPKTALVSAYRPEVPEATLIDIGIGQPPRVERLRWFDNRSAMFSVNLVPTFGTRTKTRINSAIGRVNSKQERTVRSEYFLPDRDNLLFDERYFWNGRSLTFSNNLQLEQLIAPSQRIRYGLEADWLKGTDANETQSGREPILESLRSDSHHIRHSLNYVNRFRNGTFLSLDLYQMSSRMPQDYRINGYDYATVFRDSAVADARQELDMPGRFFGARATYYFEMKGLQLVGRGGHERTRDRLRSLFAPTDRTDIADLSIANDLLYSTDRSYAELETAKKLSRRLELRALLGLDRRTLCKETPDGIGKANGLHFLPNVSLSYRLTGRSKIILRFRKSFDRPLATALYDKMVFTGYRNAGNHTDSLYFKPAESYTLAYRFNDAFTQFSAHASLNYTVSRNGFFSANRISENLGLSTMMVGADNRTRVFFYGADKLLPGTSTTLKFSGSAMNFATENEINGSGRRKVDSWSIDSKLSAISAYSGAFNHILSVQHNSSRYAASSEGNSIRTTSAFLKLQYTTDIRFGNGTFLRTNLSRYQWQNGEARQRPFVFLDASLRKRIFDNRATATLSAWNIIGAERLPFNRSTDYYSSVSDYRLLGRMILLGIRFSMN